jgi:hypothetical protein
MVANLFDTRFGIDRLYAVRRCSGCGLEELHPVPEPEELKRLYETYYTFGGENGTLYTRLREWYFSFALHRFWAGLDGDISSYATPAPAACLTLAATIIGARFEDLRTQRLPSRRT